MVAKTITTAFMLNIIMAAKTGPNPVEIVEQMGKRALDLEKELHQNNDVQRKFNSKKWLMDQKPKHESRIDISHHHTPRYR